MYTADISKVVESHGLCRLHQYADDCQVYFSVPVTEAVTAVDRLSQCVAYVSMWMSSSSLRLNPSKTLVIWLGGKHQVTKVPVDIVFRSYQRRCPQWRACVHLESSLTVSSPCLPTSTLYADQRITSYVSYDLLYARCRLMPLERSSKRSFRRAWTIATR